MSQQLIKLGCVPNKSLILTFPDFISDSLLHHFIRGYFDGDGSLYKSIYHNKKRGTYKHTRYIVNIVSTKCFCDKIHDILLSKLNINSTSCLTNKKTRPNNNITTSMRIMGNKQVYKFLSWIYDDATIFLERKFNIFKTMCQW